MTSRYLGLLMACAVLTGACGNDRSPDPVRFGCGAGQCPSGLQVAVSGLVPAGSVIEARVEGQLVGSVVLGEEIRDAGVAFFRGVVAPEVDIRLRTGATGYDWSFAPVYALSGTPGCTQCEVASVTMCFRSARMLATGGPAS